MGAPYDQFAHIVQPLTEGGMTAEATTLAMVEHQATLSARYYLTLIHFGIKPSHALEMTQQWVAICAGIEEDEEDDG